MGFRNVEFPYNEHKLEALQKALESRDRECTSELVIALDSLYEKYVPANEKETVSKKIAMDHIKDGIDENCIALIHLHDDTDDRFFTARGVNTLYEIAMRYHSALADMVDSFSVDSMTEVFDDVEYLDEIAFNVLADSIPDDERVTLEAHYEFDVGTLEFRDTEHPDMYGYNLNDLSDILEKMDGTYMTEYDREVLFNEKIKELRQDYNEGQTMTL